LTQAQSVAAAQQSYAMDKNQGGVAFGAGGGSGGGRGGFNAGGGGFGGGGGFAPMAPATQPSGYRVAQNYAQQARIVKGRAFYQNGTLWTDGQAQNAQNLKHANIVFNSDPYFELLRKHPEAAAWLSLGDEVDIVLDDTIYSVRPEANSNNH
jgi:hypothetical protein